jgi:hypothetical protein
VVAQRVESALQDIEAAAVRLRSAPKAPEYSWPVIAVINESSIPADWHAIAAALQIQADRDFLKFWKTSGHLVVTTRAAAPAGSWWLVILDDSDQAGALGYHDLTPAGLPLGKVFARTDQTYHLQSSVTASHELLEMLADPLLDDLKGILTVNGQNVLYACEVCDAVEADQLGYQINGIQVSDFVTPAWFHPGVPGPYSFRGNVGAPLQLARGGYISWIGFNSPNGWQQSTAAADPNQIAHRDMRALIAAGGHPRLTPQPGSRRERRMRIGGLQRSEAA